MSSNSSPYPRSNFFDSQDEEYKTTDGTRPPCPKGVSRAEWVAHSILRESAEMLCPVSLFEPPETPGAVHTENVEVELTEPEVYVPKTHAASHGEIDYGQRRHRARYNPVHGYLDAGVVIQDQPLDEFMAIVDAVIQTQDLPQRIADGVSDHARSMKRAGNSRDVDILEVIVRALNHPTSPLDSIQKQ